MASTYNEIHRLHEMLLEAGIEHDWIDRNLQFDPDGSVLELYREQGWEPHEWGWQIVVHKPDGDRFVSAIEGYGTCGEEVDRIEIMGLLSPEESEYDSVVGYLTAENVFARIKHYFEKNCSDTKSGI